MSLRFLGIAIALLLVSVGSASAAVGRGCTFEWQAPTTNADGTPLTDLAKYHLYVSRTSGVYPATPSAVVQAPATTVGCANVTGLTTTARYFAVVTALDTTGNESERSSEIFFDFDGTAPKAPSGFAIR